MNVLVNLAVTFILETLQVIIKNPEKAAELKTQLVGAANDIYAAYGMTPPTQA